VNRDNVLYAVIGILAGFILGYVLHEEMAARQAPRRLADGTLVGPGAAAPGNRPEGGAQAAAGSGAPMMGMVQELQQRIAANPEDAEALQQLGNLHYDIRNWGDAAQLYERYLELRPEDPDVRTDLGASYRHMGRFDAALEEFRKVTSQNPEHWQALYNEVLVLGFDMGDLETANETMVELRALQPDNPEVDRLAQALAERQEGA
jgi:tetratricopeptide (TPR) repeat protein